jgi:hypothetical protein
VPWLMPNTVLRGERRKHLTDDDETPPPKEKALITPERSESAPTNVRRLCRNAVFVPLFFLIERSPMRTDGFSIPYSRRCRLKPPPSLARIIGRLCSVSCLR